MSEIKIGRGKTARQAFGLDDTAIVPSRRTRDTHDVDLSWKIDAFKLGLPLIAAGLESPLSDDDAAAAGAVGALALIDLEALWAEHPDAARLRARLEPLRAGGAPLAASVSPKSAAALAEHALAAEIDVLVIRGEIVSAEHVSSQTEPLNLKTFIRTLDIPVIVGGCASFHAALHLMRTGAAGVLVGVSRPGLGVDVPLATAVADARAARVRHLDETSVYCHVIAAGGIGDGVALAKALAIGADAAMVDASLLLRPDDHGIAEIDGVLRRCLATCGYTDPKTFQRAEVVVAPGTIG